MFRILFNYLLPFVLGCLCGVAAFYLVTPVGVPVPDSGRGTGWGSGSGLGYCESRKMARLTGTDSFEPEQPNTALRVTYKPRALYTDMARENNTEGAVLLKVTLLASGEVGGISVVRGLPDGLNEQAIEAARKIKFEPKKVNGVPVSVAQTFEYTFDIY